MKTKLLDKADIANITAAFIILTGMFYGVMIRETQLVTTLSAAGIGYLFGKAGRRNGV